MPLNPSVTELTTAATDAALGVLCLVLLLRLQRIHAGATWKKAVWSWVFGLIVLASALGALVHGLDLSESLRAVLWQPLLLSLGLAVALFLVGALADAQGEAAARTLLPWAIGLGAGFFTLSRLFGGVFSVFVAYEVTAMIAALAIYVFLAVTRRLAGAGTVGAGIGLSIVAAVVQVSHLHVTLVAPFDHNGLFHLIQMVATTVIANGLRRGLEQEGRRPPAR